MRVSRLLFVLHPNLSRLSAIVRMGNLSEPGVVESLLGSDALCGVVDKDLGKQI